MHRPSLIPVEGHGNLARDPQTGAIINTNKSEYEQYIHNRNSNKNKEEKLEYAIHQVEELKGEIDEIKNLLLKLMSGINT